MTSLLSVRHLSASFDTDRGLVHAVDDVSFDIEPGETLGVVGESGCGKSVTALSILRLIPEPPGRFSSASRIEFEGRNILDLDAKQLRSVRGAEIAMIFQEPTTSLNPVLTVGSQIAETILAHQRVSKGEAMARAEELLAQVGIPDPSQRLHEYPHQLSGGMQQRVMIAIALSCRPKLLIADEPTTALDVTIQAQILDLLKTLKAQHGMSVMFITHDLGVLAGIADRVAVMYAGQIVEQASTSQLFASPSHPYSQGLLRAVPRLDRPSQQLVGIPGSVPDATDWPTGCRFHPRCPERFEPCDHEPPLLADLPSGARCRCWLTAPSGAAT